MSVSSILAFVLAGVAAKKARADRRDENQEFIALRVDNADLRRRVEELEGDVARANIQYRRDQELIDLWRERALGTPAMRPAALQPAGPDFRPPQIALQQHAAAQQMQNQQMAAQSQLAQYNAQQMQNQQMAAQSQLAQYNAQQGQAMGLLGAHMIVDAELWCNCVPSRAQVWAADRSE